MQWWNVCCSAVVKTALKLNGEIEKWIVQSSFHCEIDKNIVWRYNTKWDWMWKIQVSRCQCRRTVASLCQRMFWLWYAHACQDKSISLWPGPAIQLLDKDLCGSVFEPRLHWPLRSFDLCTVLPQIQVHMLLPCPFIKIKSKTILFQTWGTREEVMTRESFSRSPFFYSWWADRHISHPLSILCLGSLASWQWGGKWVSQPTKS